MGLRMGTKHFLASGLVLGCLVGVTGCGTGVGVSSVTGVLDPGGSGKQTVDAGGTPAAKPSDEKVAVSELRAYCPKVILRSDAAVNDTYEGKKKKKTDDDEEAVDPATLVYRSSITAATRKCSYAAGTMSMEIAVAGKVVPGPLAKDGGVSLPIRIEVKRGDEVLYSNIAKYDVAVSRSAGATQFIYNDPNVSFPTPEAGTLAVTVGFDQGPEKKKKASDEL